MKRIAKKNHNLKNNGKSDKTKIYQNSGVAIIIKQLKINKATTAEIKEEAKINWANEIKQAVQD